MGKNSSQAQYQFSMRDSIRMMQLRQQGPTVRIQRAIKSFRSSLNIYILQYQVSSGFSKGFWYVLSYTLLYPALLYLSPLIYSIIPLFLYNTTLHFSFLVRISPPTQSLSRCLTSVITSNETYILKSQKLTSTDNRKHTNFLGYSTQNACCQFHPLFCEFHFS